MLLYPVVSSFSLTLLHVPPSSRPIRLLPDRLRLNLVRGIVKVNATDTVPERLMTGSDLARGDALRDRSPWGGVSCGCQC